MSLTVNVGYSEKLGQPDYGSIGASCHIECELDGQLAFDDPTTFHTKVQDLYAACAEAVQVELDRRKAGKGGPSAVSRNGARRKTNPKGQTPDSANGSANHGATSRQLEYLRQLAGQVPEVGVRRLEALAQRICGKPLADLSSFDASSLIDTLKAIKAGKLELEAISEGGGP